MEIKAENYEFTVQSTKEATVGSQVKLVFTPDSIHVMKRLRDVNEFIGRITSPNTVEFCGGEFAYDETKYSFEKGQEVKVKVKFTDVSLLDDENDGTIGANVTQSLYKGSYNQVQVYTDTDEDFYVDTTDEWDIDDRVGIKINKENITLEEIIKADEEE